MTTREILKNLNWDDIFGNTSQYENLYDFLIGEYGLKEFVNGFYSKSKNKKIIKNELTKGKIPFFKNKAKKIWNLAKVQQFHDGDEMEKIQKFIDKL